MIDAMTAIETSANWIGLVGLAGLVGLLGLRYPIDRTRSGQWIRLLGLAGLLGLLGFWHPGTGALGAFGALGVWNHQDPLIHRWARFGWLGVSGIPYLLLAVVP